MDFGPGHQDLLNAQLQAEARARQAQALAGDEVLPEDPLENRAVGFAKKLVSFLILISMVGGTVWLYGGEPVTVIGAVVVSVAALVLILRWRYRSEHD